MHRQAAGLVDMPRRRRTFKPIERPDFNVVHVISMYNRHRRMRVSNDDGYPIHPGRRSARGTIGVECKLHAGPGKSVDPATRLGDKQVEARRRNSALFPFLKVFTSK